MPLRVLVVPDKFKGTLTAGDAAQAIARGWRKSRPKDVLELLPMSDGGDGFGEVMSRLLHAKPRRLETVDAAHRRCRAVWWWEAKTRTAIIESANIIGLAMLPLGKFHPFGLDTFGLGAVLRAAWSAGAKKILIGIGGSATNDGGFGLARALGWEFRDRRGREIERWIGLHMLAEIRAPDFSFGEVIVAVDVQNPLLGPRGATRVYGPQKGLRLEDFLRAETCLRRLASVVDRQRGRNFSLSQRERAGVRENTAKRATRCFHPHPSLSLKGEGLAQMPGAGAAGGLGFGLAAFLGAQLQPGFELFARHAQLSRRLRMVNLVITGEGAMDRSTAMGKGVGRIAHLCRELGIPCIGLAGTIVRSREVRRLFAQVHALTDVTALAEAKAEPAHWLADRARQAASEFP